jgi:hypothetical protein
MLWRNRVEPKELLKSQLVLRQCRLCRATRNAFCRRNTLRIAIYTDLVLNLVREHYSDFGPTLAREKLLERHGLLISRETLRGLMRDADLWHTRAPRRKAVQQPRARRQYFGELIQIDGSEHHWFEDRGPYCTVLTYVDDATNRDHVREYAGS